MALIAGYTGLLDDIHITTLVAEVWNIPLTVTSTFVAASDGVSGVSVPASFITQRDAASAASVEWMGDVNLEARVLALIGQWTNLPPAGEVEIEEGNRVTTMRVSAARASISKALHSIYGVVPTGSAAGDSVVRMEGI